ncbi:MAG TPA: hypothetical protein VF753_19710 [Terriglobales bacterium]
MSSIPQFSIAEGSPIVPTQAKHPELGGICLDRIGLERVGVERIRALPKLGQVMAASRLEVRPIPEMAASGVGVLDTLTGGWPRGCLSEICGSASSGRSSVMLAGLSAATQRQEVCALVDASDMFDPESGAAAGVDFERLLWVRCDASVREPRRHRITEKRNKNSAEMEPAVEQAMRVTDLLLQSGGFGMVVVDLGGVPFRTVRRIPVASWFRYQRAVEHAATVLLVITPAPCTQSCAMTQVKLSATGCYLSVRGEAIPAHAKLLGGISVEGELLRTRLVKPVRSVRAAFDTRAVRGVN